MKNLYRHSQLTIAGRYTGQKSNALLRRREVSTAPSAKNGKRSRHPIETPNANTTPWSHAVSCEARNALQVVMSGGEIMLGGQLGELNPQQRIYLVKILENARHLANLIATLTRDIYAGAEYDETDATRLTVSMLEG